MADPQLLAVKDPSVVMSETLARYKALTGITLAPADPRRLFMQVIVLMLAQQRQLIDFAGKQSMVKFVDAGMPIDAATWIKNLAALWGLTPAAAKPSTCTERFFAAIPAVITIQGGTRVTDGISIWETPGADQTSPPGATHLDVIVTCTTPGSATNGIATGQIATLVDPIPNIATVTNITYTGGGAEPQQTDSFRQDLRDAPESTSTAGPRGAYRQLALKASPAVADCAVLGPDDAGEMGGAAPTPGNVWLLVIEGTRDADGNLISVIPVPTGGLISTVQAATTGEEVRPLGDAVTTKAPTFVDFDCVVTYYIPRSRSKSAVAIQAAAEDAFAAFLLWQQSAIGRSINPSQLDARLVNAGAKRTTIATPNYTALYRDQSARCVYQALVYGGVEDD